LTSKEEFLARDCWWLLFGIGIFNWILAVLKAENRFIKKEKKGERERERERKSMKIS
jgi:hypothetical protein